MNKVFEVGKTYQGRSIGDHNCVIKVEVVARSAKFITTGDGKRLGVKVWDGAEYVMPWGKYSMAPSVSAAKLAARPLTNRRGECIASLEGNRA